MPDETYQQMFARVAAHYADDPDHAQRLYSYKQSVVYALHSCPLKRRNKRGLPISCFLNEASDSLEEL